MSRFASPRCAGFLCLAIAGFTAGCASRPEDPPPEAMRAARPAIALRGEATFFDGQIGAVLTIGRGRHLHGGDAGGGGPGRRTAFCMSRIFILTPFDMSMSPGF